ncbi:MAG: F0F1 ATP synthase subunit delta [Woeseiaceae bacterium]
MLVDWFTVGAQALNFLILVWLLKRFLYQPILDAIDAREQRIALSLADAAAKEAEARTERDAFRGKNEAFDQQRAARLSQAIDEAKTERQRLLDEARQAADVLRAKRQDALQREQQSLYDEIARRTRAEVFAIARKALTDLAGTGLEERMCEVFADRLRALDDEARQGLASSLKTSTHPVRVRSAFELTSEQRAAIRTALNETLAADIQVRFDTAPDVIGGIELSTNGQKLAWSIADYLASLENSVGELLEKRSESEAKAGSRPESGPAASPVETQ